MSKLNVTLCFVFSLLLIAGCRTDTGNRPAGNGSNGYNESFRKTGWITDNKYRAVVFIITEDECNKSSEQEIVEKIRFEAYKHLQRELSPDFNRNASIQIKNLADVYGKMIKGDKDCVEKNVFFYDIEKSNLKNDFEKIKNLK